MTNPFGNPKSPSPASFRPDKGGAGFSVLWILLGVVLALVAWFLPAHLGSVHPRVLEVAGGEGDSLEELWNGMIQGGNPGAARELSHPEQGLWSPGEMEAEEERKALNALGVFQPWGRRDPILERVLKGSKDLPAGAPGPVLPLLLKTTLRQHILQTLEAGITPGAGTLLSGLQWQETRLLIPVSRPGGQPLEALLVLTTLLYEGGHFRPSMTLDLMERAKMAQEKGGTLPMEEFLMALLQLASALDWGTLSEWLRLMPDVRALQWTAKWAAEHPGERSCLFAAGMMGGDGARVVHYLIQHGPKALEWLCQAVGHGQGAVVLLLKKDRPLAPSTPAMDWAVRRSLESPELMIALRWILLLLGCGFAFHGLLALTVGESGESPSRSPSLVKTLVLGFVGGAVLIGLSEPGIRNGLRPETKSSSSVRVEYKGPEAVTDTEAGSTQIMDTSTILSVLVFLCLQIFVYFICVMKIAEISRHEGSPLLKLRLVENEENLFDSGLYVGIGGTAAALVLQVMNVIEPNLVAAYSSNLFGITCVALVKIRKVRPFKRQMILDAENFQSDVRPSSRPSKPLTPFSGA